jgi:hypothetical protein
MLLHSRVLEAGPFFDCFSVHLLSSPAPGTRPTLEALIDTDVGMNVSRR